MGGATARSRPCPGLMIGRREGWSIVGRKLTGSKQIPVSPWLEVIAQDVQFFPESAIETYYAIRAAALSCRCGSYARGAHPLSPSISTGNRTFLPRVACGLALEKNEEPADAMTRELLEGNRVLHSGRLRWLIGKTATCASRIDNSTYSFFIEAGERDAAFC